MMDGSGHKAMTMVGTNAAFQFSSTPLGATFYTAQIEVLHMSRLVTVCPAEV